MPCYKVGNAIVCTRGQRPRRCFYCASPSEVLCDYPVGKDKTCDRPCCRKHSKVMGPRPGFQDNLDYCLGHAAVSENPTGDSKPDGDAGGRDSG